ncbi:hypothetical protein [Marivita lacus]|nr:hypothetical protein [Marivita lacus]
MSKAVVIGLGSGGTIVADVFWIVRDLLHADDDISSDMEVT